MPATQENKKVGEPVAETPKGVESTKPAATPITLALRQVGQEAAQKAKDNKKKAHETTYDGVGEAEPLKEDLAKSAVIPPPIKTVESPTEKPSASLQSPNSTAWKDAKVTTPRHSIDGLASLQSPNSTAWKPTDIDGPILTHRGSSVSIASAEEIRQIEEEEMIKEEDEEAVED